MRKLSLNTILSVGIALTNAYIFFPKRAKSLSFSEFLLDYSGSVEKGAPFYSGYCCCGYGRCGYGVSWFKCGKLKLFRLEW